MARLSSQLIRRALAGLIVLTLCLAGVGGRKYGFVSTALAQAQDWESSIRKFEEQDKINPPKLGCIVFTGSSSIARWETLVDEMKPLDVINRGFGGSQYSDLNQYAKRIVIAYQPRAVVVYEGDNDRAAGSSKTPESVANDARVFVQTIHFGVTGNLDLHYFHQVIPVAMERVAQNEGSKPHNSAFLTHAGPGPVHRCRFCDVRHQG